MGIYKFENLKDFNGNIHNLNKLTAFSMGAEQELIEQFEFKVHLLFEENRVNTFKNKWVFDDNEPCSIKKLAEAGFYFSGNKQEPDFVQCFFCNKQLVGWEKDDDPWEEHKKRSPQCEFALNNKPQGEYTLEQFLSLREKLVLAHHNTLVEQLMADFKNSIETINMYKQILK